MNDDDKTLNELIARARRGRPPEPPELRLGFATRVAAKWAAGEVKSDSLLVWERLARWGLAGALTACLATFLFSRDSLRGYSESSALDALAGLDASEDSL